MVKDLGRSHILIESYEPELTKKMNFFEKFWHKTVSRILPGSCWIRNPFPFYEESTNKRFCTIESLPNLLTFPEMVQPFVKSAHFYHLRNQLWRHRTLWYGRSGHLMWKIRTQTIRPQINLPKERSNKDSQPFLWASVQPKINQNAPRIENSAEDGTLKISAW